MSGHCPNCGLFVLELEDHHAGAWGTCGKAQVIIPQRVGVIEPRDREGLTDAAVRRAVVEAERRFEARQREDLARDVQEAARWALGG